MCKLLLVLGLVVGGTELLACRMLPLEKNVDKYIYDWVKETPDIYLAESVGFSKEDESVSFKVKEVIKGETVENFTVSGTVGTGNTSDFGVHRKEVFWNSVIEGRTTYDSMCRFKPEFEIGRTYLVIMKEPFQAKSFELIKNKSDWWYFRVKEIVGLKKYRRFIVKKEKSGVAAPAAVAPALAPEVPKSETP